MDLQRGITAGAESEKRLLIYFCESSAEYTDGFIEPVRGLFDNIVMVCDDPGTDFESSVSFQSLKERWQDLCRNYSYVYFVNEFWFAVLGRAEDALEFFESGSMITELCDKSDLFGDESPDEMFYSALAEYPVFFCVKKPAFESIRALLSTEQTAERLCKRLHEDNSELWGSKTFFRHFIESERWFDENTEVPLAFGIYDYVSRFSFPFIYMGVFMMYRNLLVKYGTDDKIRKLYDNVLNTDVMRKPTVQFFKRKCDAANLKDLLQINVILSSCPDIGIRYIDTAVFAHLHYAEVFTDSMEYLNKAARCCDVYISVSSDEKKKAVLALVDSEVLDHINVLLVENRGRDLSALLVIFASYIPKYKYICFLHDKRSHSGEAYTVGEIFRNCIWDNLLGGAGTVTAVRKFFSDNCDIGLLAPPPPYWGVYLGNKGDSWTICYDKTAELAKSLELNVSISRNVNPVALGTAFWCRSDALLPLLKKSWQYDDFDPEPLGIDGTFSHALERIFPYVALEKGFLTGWIMSDKFAACMLESHVILLDGILKREKDEALFRFKKPIGVKLSFKLAVIAAGTFFKSLMRFVLKKTRAVLHIRYKN